MAFGLLFYYVAHLVESSIIPIRDLLFEHRTYLPNLGLCIIVGWMLSKLRERWNHPRIFLLIVGALAVTLGTLTWHRNQMWRDPIRIWEESAGLSPNKDRPWSELGRYYLEAGRTEAASEALTRALRSRDPKSAEALEMSDSTAINLVIMLRRSGKFDEALDIVNWLIEQPISTYAKSKAYDNKGNIYFAKKAYALAEECFRKALKLYPENLSAMSNLGGVLAMQGEIAEARAMFLEVLERDPEHREARHNLDQLEKVTPDPLRRP
jgi:tetratricopeptide (TPR) repeat protein